MHQVSRREVLAGSLAALGASALLTGCSSSRGWRPLPEGVLHGPIDVPRARAARPQPAAPAAGVIARREWTGAAPILALANPMNGVRRITIHHDGMDVFTSTAKGAAAQRIEAIRRAHVGRRWADIGYHYVIDPAGRVWEGRPTRLQGAHVKDHNENNLGIVVLGNFEEQRPTPEALRALDAFVAQQMQRLAVPISEVWTHRELMPTACPGRNLQSYMAATRSGSGRLARA